ncbi:MAG: macro domain-containing protein [Rhodospirillales bacterium]|jgi:O-acetyl-ADP-ribose deacetylase (regulator of RNase III)
MAFGSIKLVLGDITTLATDAIVNAANASLLAGGGVCGAIHLAAGPELEAECLTLGRCPTGEARITKGHRLPAKYVIHAVGPRYWDGTRNEAAHLRSCYQAIFRIADDQKLSSVAIPALGTGIYRFPIKEATAIAVEEAEIAIKLSSIIVLFCCFDMRTLEIYRNIIDKRSAK